jgi:hypothetical protein
LINKIAKLALKAGQIQGLASIDAGVIHQIGSRFDRVSKAVLPKFRERVRDGSAIVRGNPGGTMLAGERTSCPLSRLTTPAYEDSTLHAAPTQATAPISRSVQRAHHAHRPECRERQRDQSALEKDGVSEGIKC